MGGSAWEDSPGGGGAGEDNVQVDWDETTLTDDAFILNKPTIPATFPDLTDTPAALGTAGQGIIVNTAGDALEFADVGDGGGAASTTAVEYLARTAVDISSAFAELTLTTALTDGYMLAFDVDSGTGNTNGGRVLVPSTLLRALPAFSAAPVDSTDVEDAYIAPVVRVTLTSIITQGLSYVSIWYKDDTHLWIIDSRQEMTGVAITGYPMAGGSSSPQSSGISLFHRIAVGAEQTLSGHLLSDFLDKFNLRVYQLHRCRCRGIALYRLHCADRR